MGREGERGIGRMYPRRLKGTREREKKYVLCFLNPFLLLFFFFLTNKLVYRDIRSGSCLCSFFVVPRDVIPATIPLLIPNKRRGDKTEYFSMERKSCVVKVIIIILSERKRATQSSLCLGMKVCLSAPPAPRSGFISSNL